MAYYLGIDGGGSKTSCAVGDEVLQLAVADAGPSNITRVGEARARESLHQGIREVCAAAKIDPRQVQRACIGVAGAGREEVAITVRKIVAELIPGEIEVVGDMAIALAAAFAEGPGVIVIAGTGSIAYGRNAKGQTARAGGWGFAVSDEGSAHWIGRAAVGSLLRAIDERFDQENEYSQNAQAAAETLPLFGTSSAVWNVHSLDEFVRRANSHPDFAALLPAIVTAAEAEDALAQHALAQAGWELAQLASIVVSRLFAQDAAVLLAMAGGVFRHSLRVRQAFGDDVRRLDLHVEVIPHIVEPVAGALQMAREARRSD